MLQTNKTLIVLVLFSALVFITVACKKDPNTKEPGNTVNTDTLNEITQPKKPKKINVIHVLDTLIEGNHIAVNWFERGKIEVYRNTTSDSIHWFSFGDFADERNHAAIILPDHTKAEKIVVSNDMILFSVVDFKGRGALFRVNISDNGSLKFAASTSGCINPVIRQSRFIYVNLNENLAVNNGGDTMTDSETPNEYVTLYEYSLKGECTKEGKTYKLPKQKLEEKNIDFYSENPESIFTFYAGYNLNKRI